MFILEHQDGTIEYHQVNGGFAVKDSKLYISLETKSLDDEAYPDSFFFALEGYPVADGLGDLDGLEINISTNIKDGTPNVFVYTTFHACEVIAKLSISVVSENEINVALNVVSDDVNYYNEKAKPNPFKGQANFVNKEMELLWLPV